MHASSNAPPARPMPSGVQPALGAALGAALPYNTSYLHATGIPGLDVPVEVVDDMAQQHRNGGPSNNSGAEAPELQQAPASAMASLHHGGGHDVPRHIGGDLSATAGLAPQLHAQPYAAFDTHPDNIFIESGASDALLHQPVSHLHHHHHHYGPIAQGSEVQSREEIDELTRAADELESTVIELKAILPSLLPAPGYTPPVL